MGSQGEDMVSTGTAAKAGLHGIEPSGAWFSIPWGFVFLSVVCAACRLLPNRVPNGLLLVTRTRQVDWLCRAMPDSAANNVFLESMACGTPVMVNRGGDISEYVAEDCKVVMSADAKANDWGERSCEKYSLGLNALREAIKTWAEKVDWKFIAICWTLA